MMSPDVVQLILGFGGIVIGMIGLKKVYEKHKKIDTESIGIVESVEVLGKNIGSRTYAITYDVQASEPFKLLDYPCRKQKPIGYECGVFYEKGNYKNNYYFKTIGQLDSRFISPSVIMLAGVIVVIGQLFT